MKILTSITIFSCFAFVNLSAQTSDSLWIDRDEDGHFRIRWRIESCELSDYLITIKSLEKGGYQTFAITDNNYHTVIGGFQECEKVNIELIGYRNGELVFKKNKDVELPCNPLGAFPKSRTKKASVLVFPFGEDNKD